MNSWKCFRRTWPTVLVRMESTQLTKKNSLRRTWPTTPARTKSRRLTSWRLPNNRKLDRPRRGRTLLIPTVPSLTAGATGPAWRYSSYRSFAMKQRNGTFSRFGLVLQRSFFFLDTTLLVQRMVAKASWGVVQSNRINGEDDIFHGPNHSIPFVINPKGKT